MLIYSVNFLLDKKIKLLRKLNHFGMKSQREMLTSYNHGAGVWSMDFSMKIVFTMQMDFTILLMNNSKIQH